MSDFVRVVVGCLAISACTEGLAYCLGARRPHIKELDESLKKNQAKLDDFLAQEKPNESAIRALKAQIQNQTTDLTKAMAPAQLVPTILNVMLLPYVMKHFRNQVLCTLPFEFFWPLSSFAKSGLENANPGEVSMSCFYFICMALCRAYSKKLFPQITVPSPFSQLTGEEGKKEEAAAVENKKDQ
ncbi:integral membrane protein [Gregarina niphandrodes]|uniref:Integral membrane protein n=1 Tax=Gregarina niphandrodes TaxID=110365 RepID=A0A023AZF1_GRENI|nr:integral membrane protein [Gregarina niphandrodes]EZG43858.1 integral membrane protein [Gregarina niphandrodes]|eukprot:XP_011132946.1 integral membrane protein [Gregarina niphandrodes]